MSADKHPYSHYEIEEQKKDADREFTKVFPLDPSPRLSAKARESLDEKLMFISNTAVVVAQPNEVNKATYSTSTKLSNEEKDDKFIHDRGVELAEKTVARQHFEELVQLKKDLAKRNMKAGKLLGMGSLGVVFELENMKGELVESAVLRIDPAEMIGNIDNPAAAKILFREKSGYYAASVVAKAEEVDLATMSTEEKYKLIEKSLAVFNSTNRGPRDEDEREGKLPHLTDLDYLKDLSSGQFMKMPGIDLLQLTDISSMHPEAITPKKGMRGLQGIDQFIEFYEQPPSLRKDIAPPEVVEKMHKQAEVLDQKVRADIGAKNIDITPTPGMLTDAEGEGVGNPKKAAGQGHG